MRDESIFQVAAEIGSPEERQAYLDVACRGDQALRAQVESLLEHLERSEGFLEAPPAGLLQTVAGCHADTAQQDALGAYPFFGQRDSAGSLGRLGPYEVQEVVGRGGMGIVLRAVDPKLHRTVALKVMRPELATSPVAVDRFLKEARAAAAVKDDHVVMIHAVHDEGPIPYLVMEFVEGETLQQKIDREGGLAVEDVVRIGREVALGLAAAHRRGLVHRDVKPANILLDNETRRARITDFGLARTLFDAKETLAGAIAGTPAYMAPEQAQGARGDQRSDLFSLGGVIYAMCSGRTPFQGETSLATLRAVCDEAHRPVRELVPSTPLWLEQIVDRLLAKDPDVRLGSAEEVARWLDWRVSEAQTESLPGATAAENSAVVPPVRRARWLTPAAAAAAFLVMVVVFIVVRQGKSTRFQAPEGANISVGTEGEVEIQLPEGRGEAPPKPRRRAADSNRTAAVDATAWELETAQLIASEQVDAVTARLTELNPGFDGHLKATIEGGVVLGLEVISTRVSDLSPIRGFPHLESLRCDGTGSDRRSVLSDLSPLAGLKLTSFNCNYSQIADLTPLKGMPLKAVSCAYTRVRDLSPLAGAPLKHLEFQGSLVSDLTPIRGLPLLSLNCSMTAVTDFSPLSGGRLTSLYFDETRVSDLSPLATLPLRTIHWRGCDPSEPGRRRIVEGISTLVEIDNKPAAEFWQGIDGR